MRPGGTGHRATDFSGALTGAAGSNRDLHAMTDEAITPAPARTSDNLPAEQRPSKPRRVSGRLKAALDAIVYEALEMDEAAKRVGMTTRNIRQAMQRPWVIAYIRQARALLVHELAAGNPRHLQTMRSSSPNGMVRLGAARVIEEIAGGGVNRGTTVNVGVNVAAGYILDLSERPRPEPSPPTPRAIEGKANAATNQQHEDK